MVDSQALSAVNTPSLGMLGSYVGLVSLPSMMVGTSTRAPYVIQGANGKEKGRKGVKKGKKQRERTGSGISLLREMAEAG